MNDTTPNTIFLVPIISAGVSFDVTSMLQPISAAYKTAGLSAAVQELDISTVQIEQYLIDDNLDDLLQHIAGRKPPPAGCDVLITAGLIPDAAQPYVGQFNAAVAQALDAEVVFVACQEHASLQQMIEINAWSFGGVSSDRVKGCIVAEGDRSCVTHLPLDLIGTVDLGGTIEFDADALSRLAQTGRERRLSPPMFRHAISEAARAANKRIVLPEGDEPRTIEAAAICQRAGFARCVLLGSRDSITQVAAERGIDLPDDIEIVDPAEIRHSYIDLLVELRQHKGMTAEKAASQLEDNVMLGTLMLYKGEVDGLVSGAVHTTANTIRPALQLIKIRPGEALVSSVFFMCLPDQVLVYADCGINPDPSIEQLADIAIQSADTAAAFGIRPRVALTSYSTGDSAAGEMIDKVRQATQIARTKRPDLLLDGPLQYDAATVPSVAAKKAPNSPIGGRATVLIFPDLDAGNIVYKAVQRSANVVSMGPVLQGLRKPVNDLSRGSLVDDIVYTIVITCVQATQS